MMALNQWLFLVFNASSHADPPVVWFAAYCAQYLVYLALATMVALWIWGEHSRRGALLATAIAAVVALGINQLLGMMWFEPRPFMIGIGHTLLSHVPENSFPSDHATLVWSLAAGLIASGASRAAGFVLIAAGLLVAWSRVYLGVHFPIDMAASATIAVAAGLLVRLPQSAIDSALLPIAENIYERLLQVLRMPIAIFPRRSIRRD